MRGGSGGGGALGYLRRRLRKGRAAFVLISEGEAVQLPGDPDRLSFISRSDTQAKYTEQSSAKRLSCLCHVLHAGLFAWALPEGWGLRFSRPGALGQAVQYRYFQGRVTYK